MTLDRRIAGVLKQYPNPEVAFYTAEVLLRLHTYTFAWEINHAKYSSAKLPHDVRLGDLPEHWLSGREQLHRDVVEIGHADLRDFVTKVLEKGEWYAEQQINIVYRTEALAGWVAKLVNQWLKTEPRFADFVDAPEDEVDARGRPVRYAQSAQFRAYISAMHAHYKILNKLIDNINEIADWATATHPDIMKFTFNQAIHRSRRWHAAERRAAESAEAPPSKAVFQHGPKEDPKRWTVFALETKAALEHEGTTQHHCVGGYWDDVVSGRTKIFSVRDKNGVSHATFEVRGGRVVQRKGPANREIVKPDLNEAIDTFVALDVDEFEHLDVDEFEHGDDDDEPDEPLENPYPFGDDEEDDDDDAPIRANPRRNTIRRNLWTAW